MDQHCRIPPGPNDTPSDGTATPDAAYQHKLTQMQARTLVPLLEPSAQSFVLQQAQIYRFTFQELRMVAQAARDLSMWREEPLERWWNEATTEVGGTTREHKKLLLRRLQDHLGQLARSEKRYPTAQPLTPTRHPVRLDQTTDNQASTILGPCPAYSDRTVCCGLHTLDTVLGCAFACSYCTIQTFFPEQAQLSQGLAARLRTLSIDSNRFYHLGTGQSSDSLAWGNRGGMLDALCNLAADHPNVLLELKTKSDNVRHLLGRTVPGNLVCSWSLNSDAVIRNEEHGTASLSRRIAAARAVADHGVKVAFHFHPMVYYQGWRDDYRMVAEQLLERFAPREVAFLSLGAVTLIRPVVQEIRRRGGETKILQMEMVADPHGKLTYPDPTKIEMYRHVVDTLRDWHEQVFLYLCMEKAAIWQAVFGRCYADNAAFERDFERHCRTHCA